MPSAEIRSRGGNIGYQLPSEGQVEIDGDPWMLKPGSDIKVTAASPFAPKSAQGDPSYQDFQKYDSPSAQANWVGGYGFFRASHSLGSEAWTGSFFSGYLEGVNVDGSMAGRVILSPPFVLETLPGLAAGMTPAESVELGGTLLVAAGTALYWRNDATGLWAAANAAPFGGTAWALRVLGGTAFVGLGDGLNMQYTSDLATFGTTSPARCLTSDKVGLYRAFGINQVQGSATGINWSTEPVLTVGDTSAPINSLAPGGGLVLLWAGKSDGLWGIPSGTGGTATRYLPMDRRWVRNCRPMIYHGPLLLVPNGRGLWSFQASSQTSGEASNISPARDAQQLGRVRGEVRAVADSARWVYATLVDTAAGTAGTATASYINRMDMRTGKWHTWVYPGLANSEMLYHRSQPLPGISPQNPSLWAGFGNKVGSLTLPINGDDPLADRAVRYTTATADVEMITSAFDFGLPDQTKHLGWIIVGAEHLQGAVKYVAIDYQLDSLGVWLTDLSPNTAYTNPSTILRFPGIPPECRWIQLRYRPRTIDSSDTPVIRYVVIHARIKVDNRWKWALSLQIAHGQGMENMAQRTTFAFGLVRKILQLREDQDVVIFKDREGYQWNVVVDEIEATTTQESGGVSPEWTVQAELTQHLTGLAAGINNALEIPTATNGAALLEREAYLDA